MIPDYRAFEIAYGREVPPPLKALYGTHELLEMAPVRFHLSSARFVVEIQYFLPITETNPQDVAHSRFAFAVTPDGYDLLVDLTEENLPIMQRERSDIDPIGVTLVDLLAGSPRRLGRGT